MRVTGGLVALVLLFGVCCASTQDVAGSVAVPVVPNDGCKEQSNCTIAGAIADNATNEKRQINKRDAILTSSVNEITTLVQEVRKVKVNKNVDKGTQRVSIAVTQKLTSVQTRIQAISRSSNLLQDLEEIKKNAKTRAEAAASAGDDDGDSTSDKIQKIGTFTKTLATNIPTLVKAVDSGDTAKAFKTGFSMVGSVLMLIPHPFAQLGGVVFSLISSLISLGKPKKEDPFKEVKQDLDDAVDTIQAEFTEKIFREAMGEFKLMMNYYRMLGGVTEQFTARRWKMLQDVGMTPSSTIAIEEMGTLNERIGQLLAKTNRNKGEAAYKLFHAFAKLGAARDMILIKFAALAPDSLEETKSNYIDSTNLARYRAFERLLCLHAPDDYTIAAAHFYYPPGHDAKSHTIYSYVSELSYEKGYFSAELEVDVMPPPALIKSGQYYIKDFGGDNYVDYNLVKVFWAQRDEYTTSSRNDNYFSALITEETKYISKGLGPQLYMNTDVKDANLPPLRFKMENKFEDADHTEVTSDIYTWMCDVEKIGTEECNEYVRYVTHSPWTRSEPGKAPAFVKANYNPPGLTSSKDLKVIKIGEEDYLGRKAAVVVIGDNKERFFMRGTEEDYYITVWVKELEREVRDGKSRIKEAFKFTLVEPELYDSHLVFLRPTMGPDDTYTCNLEDHRMAISNLGQKFSKGRISEQQCIAACIHQAKDNDKIECINIDKDNSECECIEKCEQLWTFNGYKACMLETGAKYLPGPDIGITSWGSWSAWKFCDDRRAVNGMKLQTETDRSDPTALNGVQFKCQRQIGGPHDFEGPKIEGRYGDWMNYWWTCPVGSAVSHISIRGEPPRGHNLNDKAATNLRMKCSQRGRDIVDIGDKTYYYGEYGEWTSWLKCPFGQYICGGRGKIERSNGDDTGFNRLQLACCYERLGRRRIFQG